MNTARTIRELRDALSPARARGQRIGFVPTMGALHDGHASLIRRARAECDVVVTSIFVNPTQFNDPRDLASYPRDEEGDARIAKAAGTDLLFVPAPVEMYPAEFHTIVEVRELTEVLEGAARGPGHFRGVTTVVAKLLNCVQPRVAYFGQKDAQQALVVRRMVRDLDMDVSIVVCPTVREQDGLAMSSRNVRLTPEARVRALGLSEALGAIETAFEGGERQGSRLAGIGMQKLAARGIGADAVDYLAIVDRETLAELRTVDRTALVAVAARVGGVRLIDNVLLGRD
jgi:pantoate--beta-alanine ligase